MIGVELHSLADALPLTKSYLSLDSIFACLVTGEHLDLYNLRSYSLINLHARGESEGYPVMVGSLPSSIPRPQQIAFIPCVLTWIPDMTSYKNWRWKRRGLC